MISILITPVNAGNTVVVKSITVAGLDTDNGILGLVLILTVSEITILESASISFGGQEDTSASLLKTTEYYSAVYLVPGDNSASLFISTTFTQPGVYDIILTWRDGCSTNQALSVSATVTTGTTASQANHSDVNEENTLTCNNSENMSTNTDETTPVVSEDQNPLPLDFTSIIIFSVVMLIIRRRSISK